MCLNIKSWIFNNNLLKFKILLVLMTTFILALAYKLNLNDIKMKASIYNYSLNSEEKFNKKCYPSDYNPKVETKFPIIYVDLNENLKKISNNSGNMHPKMN